MSKKTIHQTIVDGLHCKKIVGIETTNTSGHSGVWWRKEQQKWRVGITVDGRRINLGQYEKKEDAIEARIKAEKKYWN